MHGRSQTPAHFRTPGGCGGRQRPSAQYSTFHAGHGRGLQIHLLTWMLDAGPALVLTPQLTLNPMLALTSVLVRNLVLTLC